MLKQLVAKAYKNIDVRTTDVCVLKEYGTNRDIDLFTVRHAGSRPDANVSRLLVTKGRTSCFPDIEECKQELVTVVNRYRCADIRGMFSLSSNKSGDLLLDVPELAPAVFAVENFLAWLDNFTISPIAGSP